MTLSAFAKPRFEPGAIVWGARLVRPLAGGAMAELWLAERLESGGEVVIKFLGPPAGEDDPAWIDQAIERFRLEAQIAQQLGAQTRHIVQVHAAGQLAETPYLVMEHVPGRSLDAVLAERKLLETGTTVAKLVEQVAEALGVAHAANVVHRDVKPANLLVTEGERGPFVQLADSGVAKATRTSLMVDLPKDTSSALVVGSPAYASFEQLYQQELDGRSDLWTRGVVAYEALTGALPFGSAAPGRSPRRHRAHRRRLHRQASSAHTKRTPGAAAQVRSTPGIDKALAKERANGLPQSPAEMGAGAASAKPSRRRRAADALRRRGARPRDGDPRHRRRALALR